MTAQWQAWAKRTGTIPWIWQPAYGEKVAAGGTPGAKKAKNGTKAKQ